MDAKKLEKLFRLLGTAGDIEAVAALHAIKRHLGEEKGAWHRFVNQLVKVNFGIKDGNTTTIPGGQKGGRKFRPPPTQKQQTDADFMDSMRRAFKEAQEAQDTNFKRTRETVFEQPDTSDRSKAFDQAMSGINDRMRKMEGK